MAEIVVVGQIVRDLVLCVDRMPEAGTAADVVLRQETLGGKGANQAVALAQLGADVALLGVVGADRIGALVLDRARADGIDVTLVRRRAGTETGLIVDALAAGGHWRYLQHLPAEVLLTEDDVAAAAPALASARCVLLQLQQPGAAVVAAARAATGLRVLDGVPDAERRDTLLTLADVVRVDAREARLLTGAELADAAAVARAGRDLVARYGLTLAALGAPGGDVFAWPGGSRLIEHADVEVVDTTGAGDALTAAVAEVLCRGGDPEQAARAGAAAAAATVGHPGGRPRLTPARVHGPVER